MKLALNRTRQGFTLIEIISVLAVLGVLAAVAAVTVSSDAVQPAAEAQTLKSHLRFAQLKAMSDTSTWGLSIQSGSYTLIKNGSSAAINLPGEDSNSHTLDSDVTLGGSTGTITFDSRGIPYRNGTKLPSNISISVEGASSVTITRETGFIP